MNGSRTILVMAAVVAAMSACGRVESTVVTPAASLPAPKQIAIQPVQVASAEQNPDALALNEQWKQLAMTEIQSLMARKGIATPPDAPVRLSCNVQITYGNRALRYLVGFGAGTGSIQIDLKLLDQTGVERYATKSEADLAIGGFGGDMSAVVRDAIRKAVEEFGTKL